MTQHLHNSGLPLKEETMNKLMSKSAVLMMVLFGLLVVATASEADAQSRCRNRGGRYISSNYYDDRNYDDGYRYRDDRRRRSRDDDYYEDQDTTGKALKRTGIGAGVGAGAGALIGGKKGAAIGAGIGAAAGYIYHRKKVNDQRDRYYRY
jgi:hypothetical protein